MNAIPTVIGALLILLIGMIVGRIVGGIVTGILTRAKADAAFARYAGPIYGETPGATARASTSGSSRSG